MVFFCFFLFQIGHIQYLSTLIKDDRKFFRKKFGIQFLLDVIRVHYSTCPVLTKDDCKTIRGSLFGLVKFYLQKDVSSKDVLPIVNFILTVKQEGKLLSRKPDMSRFRLFFVQTVLLSSIRCFLGRSTSRIRNKEEGSYFGLETSFTQSCSSQIMSALPTNMDI